MSQRNISINLSSASRDEKNIALNLSDLNIDNNTQNYSQESTDDYLMQLRKLLLKPKGNKSETSIIGSISKRQKGMNSPIVVENEKYSNICDFEKIDISGLRSTIDSNEVNQSKNSRIQSRIDMISQPVEKNIWRGKKDDYRLSTNHLGRQRPPPSPRSDNSFLNEEGSEMSVSVSISEFDNWFKDKELWKQSTLEKVKKIKQDRAAKDKSNTVPHLLAKKSGSLADAAYARYL